MTFNEYGEPVLSGNESPAAFADVLADLLGSALHDAFCGDGNPAIDVSVEHGFQPWLAIRLSNGATWQLTPVRAGWPDDGSSRQWADERGGRVTGRDVLLAGYKGVAHRRPSWPRVSGSTPRVSTSGSRPTAGTRDGIARALDEYLGRDQLSSGSSVGQPAVPERQRRARLPTLRPGWTLWDAEPRTVILLCRCRQRDGVTARSWRRMLADVRDVVIRDLDDVLTEATGPGIEQLGLFWRGASERPASGTTSAETPACNGETASGHGVSVAVCHRRRLAEFAGMHASNLNAIEAHAREPTSGACSGWRWRWTSRLTTSSTSRTRGCTRNSCGDVATFAGSHQHARRVGAMSKKRAARKVADPNLPPRAVIYCRLSKGKATGGCD